MWARRPPLPVRIGSWCPRGSEFRSVRGRYVAAMARASAVATAGELIDALRSGVQEIEVRGTLHGLTTLSLGPGVALRGGTLLFDAGGLRLTRDNSVDAVTVRSPDGDVAIGNDTSVADLGTLSLRDVRTTGQVLLVADDAVAGGHVRVARLHVDRADVRDRVPRPPAVGAA